MEQTVNSSTAGATVMPGANTSTSGPSGVQNATTQSTPAQSTAATPTDWTSSLPENQKLYASQKGFKDPSAVLESYQNLEKLRGVPADRLLKLPDSPDAPEWGEIYDRLGRPKEASEYKFATPEGAPAANKEFTEWAQKQFHSLGLTKAQGEKLASSWNEYATGDVAKTNAEKMATLNTEKAALQREWGAAHEQQLKSCQKAAESFGLGREEVTKLESALGYSATLKFLAKIGSKLGEDSFVAGGTEGGGFKGALTPERAQAEIAELKKDQDFLRRYGAGDRDAFKKMERLHQFAYPDLPQDNF